MRSEVEVSVQELSELINRANFLRRALNLVIKVIITLFVLWVFLYIVGFALGSDTLFFVVRLLGYSLVALAAIGIADSILYDRALNKLIRATLKPTSDVGATLTNLVIMGLDESVIADYRDRADKWLALMSESVSELPAKPPTSPLPETAVLPPPSEVAELQIPETPPPLESLPEEALPQPPTPKEEKSPLEELLSRYEESAHIASLGFVEVYRVRRPAEELVAALEIPAQLEKVSVDGFLDGVGAWSGLDHPNIAKLFSAGADPIPYVEFEYCEKTLADLPKPMSVDDAAKCVFEIAAGLAYAHQKGVVHGALSPQQILVTDVGVPRVSRWWLGKAYAVDEVIDQSYLAPEHISADFGGVDQRTDVWQLGAIFYELLTGEPPFAQASRGAAVSQEPTPVSSKNPEAREVEHIVMKMLAKEKDKRYSSMQEVVGDLAAYLKKRFSESLDASRGDLQRARVFASELVCLSAKLGEPKELLKNLYLLKAYAPVSDQKTIDRLIEETRKQIESGKLSTELLHEIDSYAAGLRASQKP